MVNSFSGINVEFLLSLYTQSLESCVSLHRYLTVYPHIAGSDRNDELANNLVTQWNSYGFDSVNMYNYTVLLTFPNKSSLNILNIMSSNDFDHVLFEAKRNHWLMMR